MDASQLWELVTKARGCGADPWHWQLQLAGTKPPLLLQEKEWEQLLVPAGGWGEAKPSCISIGIYLPTDLMKYKPGSSAWQWALELRGLHHVVQQRRLFETMAACGDKYSITTQLFVGLGTSGIIHCSQDNWRCNLSLPSFPLDWNGLSSHLLDKELQHLDLTISLNNSGKCLNLAKYIILYHKRMSCATPCSHSSVVKCLHKFCKKQSLRWTFLSRNCIHTFWTGDYSLQCKTQTHRHIPRPFFSLWNANSDGCSIS